MSNQTPTDTTDDLQEAMGEKEAQSFKKRTISGAVSYTLRSLVLYSFGFVTSFILGAYLSVEAFGIYGIVTQIIALLQLFSDIGLGPILIQKKKEPTKKQYRTVFTIQFFLSFLLFAIVLGVSQFPGMKVKLGEQGIWVLLALGVSLPLGSLKTISANILERRLNFSKLVIPNIAEQLVYNTLMIYFAISGYGVLSYAYAIFARSIVGVISMWMIQPWAIGFDIDTKFIKKMLRMGTGFQASNILAAIKDQIFYLTLGWILTPTQFGYISWSKNWSQVPYMLTVQNVIAITFPAYSRLQKDTKRLKKAIEKTLFFATTSIFPILVGMSVFIYPVTQVVPDYQKWEPAITTFVLFTLSIGWAAISTPLTNTLNAIGKVHITLKIMVIWTVLTWVLTFPFLRYFGFHGVALAAFVISFTSILPVYFVNKVVHIDIVDTLWRQVVSACVMGIIGFFGISIWSMSIWHMILGMGITGTTYVLVLGMIGYKKVVYEIKSLR